MDVKSALLAAVRHMLVPIARILIRTGVGYTDFDAAARHAFAKGGESVLRERGLAVTLARLSVVTGLTQREIGRLMGDQAHLATTMSSDWLSAAQVLHAWHTKSPFVLVPVGVPMDLEYEASDSKTTFVELVQTYVPDADPGLMLTILLAAGAVTQDERGRLHATTRAFVAGELTETHIRYCARDARRFLDTVDANLTEGGRRSGRFERSVTADRGIPVRRYDEFVSYIRTAMQKTLEDIDEWTTSVGPEPGEAVIWTGVGMYHWVEQPEDFESAFKDVEQDRARVAQGH
jgi:Family of unknown function (DUF6502)